jgi:DNA-binding transcriptional MerR regulator
MTIDQIPITRFSIITRISPKALRYYDLKGLLTPGARDPFTGYRYYTADQLDRGVRIKTLCNLGFGLDEISHFLEAEAQGNRPVIDALLEDHLSRTRIEIARLQKIEALLSTRDKELMKMALIEPTIKEVPALRVISRRDKGSYETMYLTYKEIFEYMMKMGIETTGPIRELYLNDPDKTPEDELMVEIQAPIKG